MKAKDIQPGVVYAYRDHFHGRLRPIVFLAPLDRDHLYISSRTHGRAFLKALDAAAPRAGSVYNSGTIGYPAAFGREPSDLDGVTLTRFERVTSTLGRRCEYTLITRLARVIGPWGDVSASPDSPKED
jgi:hypothetical protein